tara:strand:- start:601 stop:912 length:312 start_codon:yes stop_codon:yes gene_type:complete
MNINKHENAGMLVAFAEATDHEIFDEDGDAMCEAVQTAETLGDFLESSRKWNERAGFSEGEIEGVRFVAWESVQIAKGQPRRELSVIDLGDVRIVLDFDLGVL